MLKSKSKTVLTIIVLLCITLFIINPSNCMNSTLRGGKIWLLNVMPALFPFFILTRIIITLNQTSIATLDKFTNKFFKTNNSGLIYFLSLLSGYPVGAKMISSYYENGSIDKSTATKMFSFCSTSGPMFIVGTIGIGVFKNIRIGYILLISHILGSFVNGIIFRGDNAPTNQLKIHPCKTSLNDIVYDSIISILLVGGYIIFSSVIIELLTLTNMLPTIASLISKIPYFNYDVVLSFLCGIIEITNGLIMLGNLQTSITLQIVLSSILIAFSGICIMLQSSAFLNKIGIKNHVILKQKIVQSLVTGAISAIIAIMVY